MELSSINKVSSIKVTRYTFLQEVWALGATLTTRVCSRKSILIYFQWKQKKAQNRIIIEQ